MEHNSVYPERGNISSSNSDSHQGSYCSSICPLSRIPESFWKAFTRPPFRKRHPFVFWVLIILLLILFLSFFFALFEKNDDREGEDKIGLVKIEGPILESASVTEWINKLMHRRDIKGLLVRINSPGGGAAASHEIYQALKTVSDKIPVCVSMGATAASGGFMASMAGTRIFAGPLTITGSIGVRMDIPQVQELLSKLGINQETLVSGPYKNVPSYMIPLSSADRKYLQGIINDMQEQFMEIVASSRKMEMEKVRELADGKIYTGIQAFKSGLIDELGSEQDAHKWLCSHTGVPIERPLFEKPQKRNRFMEMILKEARNMIVELFIEIKKELSVPQLVL